MRVWILFELDIVGSSVEQFGYVEFGVPLCLPLSLILHDAVELVWSEFR